MGSVAPSMAPGVEPAPSIHFAYSETTGFSSAAASAAAAGAFSAMPAAPASAVASPPSSASAASSRLFRSFTSCCKAATVALSSVTSAWRSLPPVDSAAATALAASIAFASSSSVSSPGSAATSTSSSTFQAARSFVAVSMISAFFQRPTFSFSMRSARSRASRAPSSTQRLAQPAPGLRAAKPASSLPSQQSQMPSSTRDA
mmetsp:Transcript_70553/g.228514  ORF Transcript_70553/g.228514 Transcript_70553/m.228514 type:complete len:202 (-) Transcript_70553:180-785(-)